MGNGDPIFPIYRRKAGTQPLWPFQKHNPRALSISDLGRLRQKALGSPSQWKTRGRLAIRTAGLPQARPLRVGVDFLGAGMAPSRAAEPPIMASSS